MVGHRIGSADVRKRLTRVPGYSRCMARVLAIFFGVAVWIFGLIDCLRAPRAEVRLLPKSVWLVTILLVPGIGALAYLLLGRPLRRQQPGGGGFGAKRGPRPPDDDPEFLRKIDEQAWRERMKRKRGAGDAAGEEPQSPA